MASRYRVLALDDEALALNLIERAFEEDEDVDLFLTTSAAKALQIAEEADIELAVADQRMPEMSGMEFLTRFRDVRPGAVRILLTAYPDLEVVLKAINEGLLYRFILKPWDPEDMRITIRQAVDAKRIADDNQRMAAQLKVQFDELVEAERMAIVGRLSAGIAHELGNPVSSLLGNLDLLAPEFERLMTLFPPMDAVQGSFDAERQARRDHIQSRVHRLMVAMRKAGEQVYAITNNLKRYSHPGEEEPGLWDVNHGVESALALLSYRLKKYAKVERDFGDVPRILCRGQELIQVLVNLIANAADSLEEAGGGVLTLETRATLKAVEISVRDNGVGIPEEVRDRLFIPFVTTKTVGKGTGLGLSICKGIVDRHGGTIAVQSEAGKGASFTVRLPRFQRRAAVSS